MVLNELKKIRMQQYLMNKKEFAQLIGVSEQQYCRYEGASAQPSLEVALRISNALNKSVNEIWAVSPEITG